MRRMNAAPEDGSGLGYPWVWGGEEAAWDILVFGEERRRSAAAARTTEPAVNGYPSCNVTGRKQEA
jgi:hypothetical protein